jgi:hypothetical protein
VRIVMCGPQKSMRGAISRAAISTVSYIDGVIYELQVYIISKAINQSWQKPRFFANTWQAGFSGFITGFSGVFRFLLTIVFS